MRITQPARLPPYTAFGFVDGAHIKAFALSVFYQAFYYTHDGIMLGTVGIGSTPELAARDLWQKMHKYD